MTRLLIGLTAGSIDSIWMRGAVQGRGFPASSHDIRHRPQ